MRDAARQVADAQLACTSGILQSHPQPPTPHPLPPISQIRSPKLRSPDPSPEALRRRRDASVRRARSVRARGGRGIGRVGGRRRFAGMRPGAIARRVPAPGMRRGTRWFALWARSSWRMATRISKRTRPSSRFTSGESLPGGPAALPPRPWRCRASWRSQRPIDERLVEPELGGECAQIVVVALRARSSRSWRASGSTDRRGVVLARAPREIDRRLLVGPALHDSLEPGQEILARVSAALCAWAPPARAAERLRALSASCRAGRRARRGSRDRRRSGLSNTRLRRRDSWSAPGSPNRTSAGLPLGRAPSG